MNGLRVPNLAIFQTVLLRTQSCQESQLSSDAEVRDDDVEGLVEQLILADFRHEVVPDALLSRDRTLDASLEQTIVPLVTGSFHHRLCRLRIRQLIEAECLQVHDVSNVEGKDPVVCSVVLHSERAASRDLELLLYLELVHLLERLEGDLEFLLLSHSILEVVSALLEVPLADFEELLLDLDQLIDDVVRPAYLLLEDLDLLRHVLTAAAVRCSRAIPASFRDASLAITAEWGVHAEVVLVTLTVSASQRAIRITPEEWVQEVARERLRPDLVVTPIEVDRLLQTKRMDALQALPLVLDLLWVREVAQRHATVVQGLAALLLLARAQLVEVGHGVGLADLVLGELVEVRLDQRAVLAVGAFSALVGEPCRHSRLLLGERGVVRVKLVRR